MNTKNLKARFERHLLKIWYTQQKPTGLIGWGLIVLEMIYKALRWFSQQDTKTRQSKLATSPPVLVVGNLIAGGAGKTPIVMAICKHLVAKNFKVGIVSRGFGRRTTEVVLLNTGAPGKLPPASAVGDEPLFLCLETACPVAVGANRQKAVQVLLRAHPDLDLVISDDGLQHHRLKRQFEWVVFDQRGQGNGRLLPAGPLRESLKRIADVEAVLASNVTLTQLSHALNMPVQINWHEIQVSLTGFQHLHTGAQLTSAQAAQQWKHETVAAFTGIANPDKLFKILHRADIAPQEMQALPDHFAYPPNFCDHFNHSILITTGKDAVKLSPLNTKIWVAQIHVKLPAPLTHALEACIGSTIN